MDVNKCDNIRALEKIDKMSAFCFKGDNICNLMFAFLHTKSLLKWVYSKREEFPFRVNPFQKGGKTNLWIVLPLLKVYQFPLIGLTTSLRKHPYSNI